MITRSDARPKAFFFGVSALIDYHLNYRRMDGSGNIINNINHGRLSALFILATRFPICDRHGLEATERLALTVEFILFTLGEQAFAYMHLPAYNGGAHRHVQIIRTMALFLYNSVLSAFYSFFSGYCCRLRPVSSHGSGLFLLLAWKSIER